MYEGVDYFKNSLCTRVLITLKKKNVYEGIDFFEKSLCVRGLITLITLKIIRV